MQPAIQGLSLPPHPKGLSRTSLGQLEKLGYDCELDNSIALKLNSLILIIELLLYENVFLLKKYTLIYLKVKGHHVYD